jgi:spore maturation protein CgeB
MQEYGIVSNRIFDAGACGACIISDFQASLDEIFPKPSLITYSNQMELAEKLAYLEKNEEEIKLMKANIRQTIIEHHTFNHRAEEILGVVSKLQNR